MTRPNEETSSIDMLRWATEMLANTTEAQRHANITLAPYGCELNVWTVDKKATAAVIRAIGGKWEKNDPKAGSFNAEFAIWKQYLGNGNHIQIMIEREEVCERVEVGRHIEDVEVTLTSKTEEREVIDYEWTCHPVLNDAEVAA